jgi:hypothetical protein
VCVAVIALLISLLLPALGRAKEAARTARCAANQKQLILGWTAYANDYHDRAMPLAYTSSQDVGSGDAVYWWGTFGQVDGMVVHERGFIAPYIGAVLSRRSVFECPNQPWGSYYPQGYAAEPTSTYGYNGYYLSPSRTPGWSRSIGSRPWRRLGEIQRPCELFVFADTLVPMDPPRNTALLDPPMLWTSYGWEENQSPTTAFRHGRERSGEGVCTIAHADGSVRPYHSRPEWLLYPEIAVGSVGSSNDPNYVPDAADWR